MLINIMTIEEFEFWKKMREAEDVCDCCGGPAEIPQNQMFAICDFCKDE